MLAEGAGDLREHARLVLDADPQEVPLMGDGVADFRGWRVGFEHAGRSEGDRRPAHHRVDDVGHDGRGGRHLPGAQTVEEHSTDRVADDADGVVGAAGLGQRRADLHQARCHPHRQPAVVSAGHGHETNPIAEFAGVFQEVEVEAIDAGPRDLGPRHPDSERQMGEYRQFLRGVGAVNVHRGVGFGESLGLGELEHLGVVGTILLHPRQDEVARAVQDAADRVDAVGCEALADGGHNRNAAGHGRLEGDRTAPLAGQLEEFRAMLCQQCLVGGDHILPVLEQLDHHRAGRLQSPDKQNRHGDRWIPRDVADVGRDLPARHLHATVLGDVLDDGPFDDDRSAGVPRDMVGRLDEQADNARPDGAQTDDADTDWCAHGGNDSKK